MKLEKFDPMTEDYTPEGSDMVLTIQSVNAGVMRRVQSNVLAGTDNTMMRAAMLLFVHGIESVDNATDADGKKIETGAALWDALNEGDREHAALIDTIAMKLTDKNKFTAETEKNLES